MKHDIYRKMNSLKWFGVLVSFFVLDVKQAMGDTNRTCFCVINNVKSFYTVDVSSAKQQPHPLYVEIASAGKKETKELKQQGNSLCVDQSGPTQVTLHFKDGVQSLNGSVQYHTFNVTPNGGTCGTNNYSRVQLTCVNNVIQASMGSKVISS